MKRLFAIFLSLILPLTSTAQVLLDDIAEDELPELPELRQYSVEVIVFAYTEDVHTGTEIFVPEPLPEPELLYDEDGFPILEPVDGDPPGEESEAADAPEEAADDTPVDDAPADAMVDEPGVEEPVTFTFELMPEEDYALLDALATLDELDAYEPLMHFGWIQGMLPDTETAALTLDTFAAPPAGLEGELTLYLSRYLHLVVDLELAADREAMTDPGDGYLTDPGVSPGRTEQPVPVYADRRMFGWEEYRAPDEPRYAPLMYRISEDRIVRNGELRYYDHPRFGVIARVARIEAEEDPGEAEPDVALPASALAQ